MSNKGKHGVRNPKKSKPNPYAKRRNRGGWGNEPRDDEWQDNERWSRHDEQDDSYEDWGDEDFDPNYEDEDDNG